MDQNNDFGIIVYEEGSGNLIGVNKNIHKCYNVIYNPFLNCCNMKDLCSDLLDKKRLNQLTNNVKIRVKLDIFRLNQ